MRNVAGEKTITARRRAREAVLRALYWSESTGESVVEVPLTELLRRHRVRREAAGFARRLAGSVEEHKEEYSRSIEKLLENWELKRLSRIDRIILLMGVCELDQFIDVPPRVVIDEAVELAKKYSTEKSFAFVNGILDAVAKGKGLFPDDQEPGEKLVSGVDDVL